MNKQKTFRENSEKYEENESGVSVKVRESADSHTTKAQTLLINGISFINDVDLVKAPVKVLNLFKSLYHYSFSNAFQITQRSLEAKLSFLSSFKCLRRPQKFLEV